MNLLSTIEPHAAALESCAHAMEAAGIGGDQERGHAVVLRKMAGQMRSEAALGRLPHIYESTGRLHAAAQSSTPSYGVSGALRACKEAGVVVPAGNRFNSIAELDRALDAAFAGNPSPLVRQRRMQLKATLAAVGMLQEEQPVDEKRVMHAVKLLKAAGIKVPTTHAFTLDEINTELDATTLSPADRISLKEHLRAAGLLDATDGLVERPSFSASALRISRSIFQQIGIDEPSPGHKLNLAAVNAAMTKAGFSAERSIPMKETLAAAGFLD
jgi:hypothetical protein